VSIKPAHYKKLLVPIIVILTMMLQSSSVFAQAAPSSDHPFQSSPAEIGDDETPVPTEEPAPAPADQIDEEPTLEPEDQLAEPTEEPGAEPTVEEPTEEPTEESTEEATVPPETPDDRESTAVAPFSWSLQIDDISEDGIDQAVQIQGQLENAGMSSDVRSAGKNRYVMEVAGENGTAEIQEALYEYLDGKIDFIGGAAEVSLRMPVTGREQFSISLESNLSTGYSWQVVQAESGGARIRSSQEFSYRGGIGTPEKQTITFNPAQSGEASIHLVYRRPFGADETINRHLTVQFGEVQKSIDLSDPSPKVISAGEGMSSSADSQPIDEIPLKGALPSSWDWRTQGVVPAVRDQSTCGSCWAFGTVGVMESAVAIDEGSPPDLSEQFLVSCNYDGWDCNGGLTAHKYHYDTLGKNQSAVGAVLEADKPYTATNGTCTVAYSHPYQQTDWKFVNGSEWSLPSVTAIKNAIYTYGPVTAGVCVGSEFQGYDGGVFSTNENCAGGYTNHQIVLVGWDDADGAWILRNSWGTTWGESGYMRIKYGISRVGEGTSWATTLDPAPDAIVLESPANKGLTNDSTTDFTWQSQAYSDTYHLQIALDSGFLNIVEEQDDISGTSTSSVGLSDGKYYWRVQGKNEDSVFGAWSAVWYFTLDTIAPDKPLLKKPADGSVIAGTPTFSWKKAKNGVLSQFEYGLSDDPESYIHRSAEIPKTTKYTPPEMDTLTTFYWFVRMQDAAGNWSEWSDPFTVMIVQPVPGSPTLISPANKSATNDNTPAFDWGEVYYDDGGYELMVDDDKKFGSPDIHETTLTGVTEFTAASPLADGEYYWMVRAQNENAEWGKWSKTAVFTVDIIPPEKPLLSKPTDGSEIVGTPTFSWKKVKDGVVSQFEYGLSDDPDSYLHRSAEIPKTTKYTPPAMDTMTTFYWFVRVQDAAGNWGDWSDPFTVMILPPIPGSPTLVSPANKSAINDNTPTFDWLEVNYDDGGYGLMVDEDKRFGSPEIGTTTLAGVTEYTPGSPLADGSYYWKVQAKNENGEWGKWSKVRKFTVDTTPPAVPTLKSPADGSNVVGTPAFEWYGVTDAVAYRFEYGEADDPETYTYRSDVINTVTTYTPPTMDIMITYYWFVQAQDAVGNWSDWSDPFTVKIIPPKPAAPALISPAWGYVTLDTSFDVSWDAVDYGNTYQIRIDNSSSFSSPDYTYDTGVGATSYTIGPLPLGWWYWQVRAQNVNSEYGDWSIKRYFIISTTFDTQFNTDGDFEGWEERPGAAWSVGSGYLSNTSLSSGYTSSASYTGSDFTAFTYEARLKMTAPTYGYYNHYGMVVRGTPTFDSYNDWNNGYYFDIWQINDAYGQDACYSVIRITNGVWSSLLGWYWYCYDDINFGDFNTLKVVAQAGDLKFYVNDLNLFQRYNVSGPMSGRLGIYSWGNSTHTYTTQVDWATAGLPEWVTAARTMGEADASGYLKLEPVQSFEELHQAVPVFVPIE
jgi:C1A family cysteine protease